MASSISFLIGKRLGRLTNSISDDGTLVDGSTFSNSIAAGIDSASVIDLVDSAYVSARSGGGLAFLAYFSSNADTTISQSATYAFNAVKFNIGSHFNTGTSTFTAPVAGVYLFTTSIFFTNSGGNTQTMGASLKVNGAAYSGSDAVQIHRTPNECGGIITGEAAWNVYLSANDTVVIYARTNNNRIYTGHTWFGGYLIG